MKFRLTLNIGSIDQKRLNLDEGASEGDVVDVDRKVGDELQARGWAVPVDAAPRTGAKHVKIEGLASVPPAADLKADPPPSGVATANTSTGAATGATGGGRSNNR